MHVLLVMGLAILPATALTQRWGELLLPPITVARGVVLVFEVNVGVGAALVLLLGFAGWVLETAPPLSRRFTAAAITVGLMSAAVSLLRALAIVTFDPEREGDQPPA